MNPATRSIERALRGGSPEDRSLGACVIIFRSRASATLSVITPCSRASDRVRHSPGRPRRGTPDAARSVYVRSTSQRDRSSPSIVDGRVAAGVGTERVKCTRFLRTGSNDSRRSSLAGNRSDHASEPRVDGNERARCRADSSSAWGTSTASGVRSGAARSAISTSVRDAPGEFPIWALRARSSARQFCSLGGESPPATPDALTPRPRPTRSPLTLPTPSHLTGTHIQTGEEVGIKLVRPRHACRTHRPRPKRNPKLWSHARASSALSASFSSSRAPPPCVRTRGIALPRDTGVPPRRILTPERSSFPSPASLSPPFRNR